MICGGATIARLATRSLDNAMPISISYKLSSDTGHVFG